MLTNLTQRFPSDEIMKLILARTLNWYGDRLQLMNRSEKAQTCYRESFDIRMAMSKEYLGTSDYWMELTRMIQAMASLCLKTGETVPTLRFMNEHVDASPSNWRVWAIRGRFQRMMGNTEEAATDLNRSIELGADDAAVWYDLGHNCLISGDLDGLCRRRLDLAKRASLDDHTLGIAYFRTGDYRAAID